jgi:Fe(3+) dicitrate transport protein
MMNNRRLKYAGLAFGVLASGVLSQTHAVMAQAPLMREPDVIVIGQRANLLTIPGSGAVIDMRELEKSRPVSLNEALRQVPGIFPRD